MQNALKKGTSFGPTLLNWKLKEKKKISARD